MNYTSNVYSDTGLVPTNFILKSLASGTAVDLQLCPSVPELQESPEVEEKIAEATYVVMKHHIAMESYQDLAATFPTLPRSHKVASYIANSLSSLNIYIYIGEREKRQYTCAICYKNARQQLWCTILFHRIIAREG